MSRFAHNSQICKHFLLLSLTFWIWTIKGENQSFGPMPSHGNSTRRVLPSPQNIAPARQSPPSSGYAPVTTSNQKDMNYMQKEDEEGQDVPTWVVVLICVLAGFVVVACCLCGLKFYYWKKDHGTYSIWNEREPNVESMYARESGVLFEKLDIESGLTEDQCYEIPVDSFVTPQRIYIAGVRITPVKESISESMKTNEQRMSESGKRMASIDDTDYCSVVDRINHAADVLNKTERISDPVYGNTSQRSSKSSYSTRDSQSERVLTSPVDSPRKETYCKPLPVVVGEQPVTCETYMLNARDQDRVSALVNRPLPQTPLLSPPAMVDSCASLDRSLLKQEKEDKLEKPKVIFRTLPRPRKLRQLHVPKPLINAISRSASSSDVSKEPRMNDHVACDPRECTLTKIKKRMSQSLDTLIASQRVSHFYENPDLMPSQNKLEEQRGSEGPNGILGVTVDPPYASVSSSSVSEDVPRDKEHLYARISTVMSSSEERLNRHSYASIHYRPRMPSPDPPRPKSRHTYISIIFGSAESVSVSPQECATAGEIPKSHSCSDLSSVLRSTTANYDELPRGDTQPKNTYVNVAEMLKDSEDFPPIQFSPPLNSTKAHEDSSSTDERIPSTDERLPSGCTPEDTAKNNNLLSVSGTNCRYVNVNEALEDSFVESGGRPHQESSTSSETGIHHRAYENLLNFRGDSSYLADNSGSTMDDSMEFSECPTGRAFSASSSRNSESSNLSESYYGVPKTPAIPLTRLNEILGTYSGTENGGNIEMYNKFNGVTVNGLDKRTENQAKTLSTYLEGRLVKGLVPDEDTVVFETKPEMEDVSEHHIYENYMSNDTQSSSTDESSSNPDKISLASSLSIDDKENENQPLISRTTDADVNGNSVGETCVGKLELRRNSLVENSLPEESLA